MKLIREGLRILTQNHIKIMEILEDLAGYIHIDALKKKIKIKKSFNTLIMDLIKYKFVTYKDKSYKLSISGYDALAITSLTSKGLIKFGSPIGIGKESDIYFCEYKKDKKVLNCAAKVSRLGRNTYKNFSDRNMKSGNIFEINSENAQREYSYLLEFNDMQTPEVFCCDRHIIIMEYLEGFVPMHQVKPSDEIGRKCLKFIEEFWERGFVHGDFNEFNIMVSEEENKIKVIDFPQVVRNTDKRAANLLKRDVECIYKFFYKKNRVRLESGYLDTLLENFGEKIEI